MGKSLKQLCVKTALAILRGLEYIAKPFFIVGDAVIIKPVASVGKFIYRAIVISAYRWIIKCADMLEQSFLPVRNKYVYPFISKYFTHIIIIVLAGAVTYTNVYAQETRSQEFGQKSLLFALVRGTDEETELFEETAIEPISATYTDALSTTVSKQLAAIPDADVDIVEEQITTTQGGTALLKPEVSSISASQTARSKAVEYTVKDGDSLGAIAQQFNLTPNTILWANDLASRNMIRAGQVLKIPPVDGIAITVKKGDTLKSIASKYKGDVSKIIAFNRLADENDIAVGQQLMIPEGQQYYAPAPVVPRATTTRLTNAPDTAPTGKMLWPTTARRISQYFNWRHTGLDIDGDFGDPVWAADDGIVTTALCQKKGYGCHVIIDHGGGLATLYGHFRKILVEKGQSVKRGQLIGEEGSTGWSTGAHVHFEVRIGGKKYNPLSYIR